MGRMCLNGPAGPGLCRAASLIVFRQPAADPRRVGLFLIVFRGTTTEVGLMTKAEDSKKVRVHYTGSLDDGTVFDSSRERDPLEFTIGSNEIIPAVENAVKGMEEGEEKQVKVAPAEAYGERNEQAIMDVSKEQLPNDMEIQVGMVLQGSTQQGDTMRLR